MASKIGRDVLCTKWRHEKLASRYWLRRRKVAPYGVNFNSFLGFIAKIEDFFLFLCRYIIKNIITLIPWSDDSDHVSWLCKELLDHTWLRLMWYDRSWRSHSTWSDPSDQITKVIMYISRAYRLELPILRCALVLDDCFILSHSADPDEMPPHLGIYCLPSIHLGV